MRRMLRLGFRSKLTLAMVASSTLSLLAAGAMLFAHERRHARDEMQDDARSLSEVVASNSVAAVAFGDVAAAESTLSGLRLKPDVLRATLFTAKGDVLASYTRGRAITPIVTPAAPGAVHGDGVTRVDLPIQHRGTQVGWLALEADLSELDSRLRRNAEGLAVVLLVSGLVGALASAGLQASVFRPVWQLTRVIREVHESGQYAARVPVERNDELGALATSFNEMLGRIERQDLELRMARDGLERRVEERVAELRQEVADRKRAELALQQSEEHYRLLFESNPHPMWVYDLGSLAITAVNTAAVRHYGYSRGEFLTMTIEDLRPPEDVGELHEHLAGIRQGGEPDQREGRTWRHRKKDGSVIEVEVSGSPLRVQSVDARLVLAHDVTERRALEVQLAQAQKMETVGRLAGGVAHDFNNILGVILGYAELLIRKLPDGAARSKLDQIQRAAERAAALTRQLLAFSRKQVLTPKILDLNASVNDLLPMLRRLIGEDIQLSVNAAPDLSHVKADPTQLEQVVMNLAVNSRDAMPTGGCLVITTANVHLGARVLGPHEDVPPGKYVALSVADSGCGMDPQALQRAFEPFFTTKDHGRGTGLGLATVYGIVRQSGGHVVAASEVGRGTTITVYLPQVDEAQSSPSAAASPPLRSGRGTVLVVEDEIALRELTQELLESLGYTAVCAGSGAEALVIAEQGEPIDVLLTDLVMPGMNGRELAERLARLRPGLPVVFMSGYTDETLGRQGLLDPETVLIEKPFRPADLSESIARALAAARASQGACATPSEAAVVA